MQTRFDGIHVRYSARGIPSFYLEMWHDGLNKHRMIRGESEAVVKMKATLQTQEWESRWETIQTKNNALDAKMRGRQAVEQRKNLAVERTEEAQAILHSLEATLKHTLNINDAIDWERLKDKTPFPEKKPAAPKKCSPPQLSSLAEKPNPESLRYRPKLGLFDSIFSSRREKKIAAMRDEYERDLGEWQVSAQRTKESNDAVLKRHQETVAQQTFEYEARLMSWQERSNAYSKQKADEAALVDLKRQAYEQKDPDAILEYCELVLTSSQYPEYFPKEFDLEYSAEARALIIDYKMPAPDDLPRLKGVRYVASKDQFEDQFISDSQSIKQYDEVLYQLALRTIHEIFEADVIRVVDVVVFNGIVTAIDRTNGKPITACVMSVQTNREVFLEIDLSRADPKACFKSLKGVGSAKLHGLVPVAPIMALAKEDSRFVDAYAVVDSLDAGVNLAAMDWQDFEHLIREVFAKEFALSGGEVKVTQASRDGGVDAIAFDPDPIRGGKIVIQAKRYTNTVNVSAVRDLYGTVLNEGATKGILVTTSDYGPDSYAFANGKPIVLLSGANLLHMLEKHGHQARINIREAKQVLANS
jgi:restriction system protein